VTLDELVGRCARVAAGGGVPVWTLGCFRRRSITFSTGASDAETRVMWLQSRGLTADLRLPAGYPRLTGAAPLAELGPEVLVALAEAEGGLARTLWDGRAMSWSDWTSFQTHDRWPEPGLLARVGDCLTEHAPSGAYVEDWRLQPSAGGPLIGLRLIEERDADAGRVRHRGGGLLVCGDHAALVRGRPAPLPLTGTIAEIVRAHGRDRSLMRAVFAFEASYATRSGDGTFIVGASTDPLRIGHALLDPTGFAHDERDGVVIQRTHEGGAPVERLFTIDTLEANVAFPLATEASAEGQRWLAREGPALLARARRPSAA
jgi:hypothetical protein